MLGVPVDPSTFKPDLVGTAFDVEPRPTTYGWGQTVTVDYRFTNQGLGYASGPFTNGVYLSNDTKLDASDVLLKRDSYNGVAANATLGTSFTVTLPSSPPAGFTNGPMNLILAVDDGQVLDESNESNNSGLGFAIDYRSVSISGTPPTPGAPTIGSFTASATTLVRGEYVNLTADNVTDDGVVNDVVFYMDTNGNGNLDSSDRYLDNGSKNGTTFTSRLSTSGWPVGNVTIFARAKDNLENYSLVKSVQVTVQGVGIATPDAYERNDTLATAAYLGGAGTYQVANLSITQNDQDFFSFDVPDGTANVQVQITFIQEAPQNGPIGDLALELLDHSGNSIGFSDVSHAGNTSEQISVTVGPGRYIVHVFGQTVVGLGGTDTNSNYALHVSATPPAGYPVSGAMTADPNPVRQGDPVSLALIGSTVSPGSSIDSVYFFRDANQDGVEQLNELLGRASHSAGSPSYQWSGSTTDWPLGASKIFAFVIDSLGRESLAAAMDAQVSANLAPAITSLLVPSMVTQGDTFIMTAQGVSDDESVNQVLFFRDVNANGALDGGDMSLGAGVQSGDSWSLAVDTSGFPLGDSVLLAMAIDNRGLQSALVTADVQIQQRVNQPPTISSLSGPSSVALNGSFTIQASGVTDPDGTVSQVVFYLDSNANNQLDAGDANLGSGIQDGMAWSKDIATANWAPGQALLFAEATDNGSPPAKNAQSFSINVVNNAPTISDIPDQTTAEDTATPAIPFTLSDAESAANTLIVTATSSDQKLVPDANITLGGSDVNRTVIVTPSLNQSGSTTITVAVSDGNLTISDTFVLTVFVPTTVAGRFLFYSGSAWDKTGTSVKPYTPLPFSDDNAIATDKSAYIAGSGQAAFANVISYDQGINGIMVDLEGGGNHGGISVGTITQDFTFKVGNNNAPNTWPVNTVLPTTVTVRAGAGVSGSDRVELIWPSGSIKEKWLEVDVLSTTAGSPHTGLAANDVFFYGDALGNSGGGDTVNLSETTSVDELGARNNGASLLNNIPISNVFDYNRDGLVSSVDQLLARNNPATLSATRYLNIPGGVFSPPPGGGSVADSGAAPATSIDSTVSSALVSSSAASAPSAPAIPAWIVNRLSHVDLNSGPVVKYFEHLAHENTAKAKAILVKADQVADVLGLDDELLDSLLVNIG